MILADKFQAGKNGTAWDQRPRFWNCSRSTRRSEDGNDPGSYCLFVVAWVNMAMHKSLTPSSLLSEIWIPD